MLSPRPLRPAPCLALVSAAVAMGAAAWAEEAHYPSVSVDVSTLELEGDRTYASDDATAKNVDVFATVEPAIKVSLTPEFSLNMLWVLEPVRAPGPDDDRVFEEIGRAHV